MCYYFTAAQGGKGTGQQILRSNAISGLEICLCNASTGGRVAGN